MKTLNSDICVVNYVNNKNAVPDIEDKLWTFISVFVPDHCILL